MAGVLLAFSISVLPGLKTLPVPVAMSSMQSANAAILNPLFLILFMGTALSCVVAAAATPFTDGGRSALIITGAVLYVVGCFAVTVMLNVPLNDALAAADSTTATGAATWEKFATEWVLWNNVRIAAATAACAVLILGQGRSALG
ncbi:Integral-membrane protein [Rhodococcus sp. AW25M09]|nr:Integral-membrane protein [Rhodococcus sp. AW25M09]